MIREQMIETDSIFSILSNIKELAEKIGETGDFFLEEYKKKESEEMKRKEKNDEIR